MNDESNDCALTYPRTPSLETLDSPHPLTSNLISPTNRQVGGLDVCNIHEERPEFYENDFPWDNDDAFLHFDPHLGGQHQFQSMYITGDQVIHSDESDIGQGTYTTPTEAGKQRKSKTRKTSSPEQSDALPITKKKKTAKVKGKQRMVEDDDPLLDEAWEARLKESIIKDNPLHLRILRFEVRGIAREFKCSTDWPSVSLFILRYFCGRRPTKRNHPDG
jgi:hypothetical protein